MAEKKGTLQHSSSGSDLLVVDESDGGCCRTIRYSAPIKCCCSIADKLGEVGMLLLSASMAVIVGVIIQSGYESVDDIPENIPLWLGFPGELWLNGLKLIVIPMIFSNIVCSVVSLKRLPNAGSLGGMTVGFYSCTTLFAAMEGLIFHNMIVAPNLISQNHTTGEMSTSSSFTFEEVSFSESVQAIFFSILPPNIIDAMATDNLLGVIFFAIGMGLLMHPDTHTGIIKLCEEMNDVSAMVVHALVWWTPLGVFSLVCPNFIVGDISTIFGSVGLFLAAVLSGIFFHGAVVYPVLFFVAGGGNPFPYMKKAMQACCVALSLSSSAATLPTTLLVAKANGVRDHIAKFVVTLGCVCNMDGTAIGFPIAVLFLAQEQGIMLSFGTQIIVAITSTVASMGAAPIPSAGLVLLVMIMGANGVPITSTFGLVLAVDWIYDRPETAVNVLGDSLAAVLIDKKIGATIDPSLIPGDDSYLSQGARKSISFAQRPSSQSFANLGNTAIIQEDKEEL